MQCCRGETSWHAGCSCSHPEGTMEDRTPISASEIHRHRPLVDSAARRVLRRLPRGAVQREDLEAAGMCGLVDALRRRAGRSEEEFEWYARVKVRGAIIDELRKRDWASRSVRQQLRRESTTAEGDRAEPFMQSLDASFGEELAGTIGGESSLELVERWSDRSALDRAVSRLPARDAIILRMHYFDDVPFKDIAEKLEVTPARVSQLHARALEALRGMLAEWPLVA